MPEDGDNVTEPRRLDGSVTDQDTGPPTAEIVNEPPSKGERMIVAGDTVIVAAVAVDADASAPDD